LKFNVPFQHKCGYIRDETGRRQSCQEWCTGQETDGSSDRSFQTEVAAAVNGLSLMVARPVREMTRAAVDEHH